MKIETSGSAQDITNLIFSVIIITSFITAPVLISLDFFILPALEGLTIIINHMDYIIENEIQTIVNNTTIEPTMQTSEMIKEIHKASNAANELTTNLIAFLFLYLLGIMAMIIILVWMPYKISYWLCTKYFPITKGVKIWMKK